MTLTTTLVLQAIAAGHGYGFDIVQVTGYATGTVYPALRRLEEAGYLRSAWESEAKAFRENRPQRRYYEPTPAGLAALKRATAALRALGALMPAPKGAL
jgi:PadR family transcriptional regulator, regulatory protein PadR